ncbi:MAG TPA: PASTA domain-containing protein [Cyclobacteriaceae bacterium]|nr:PASTA domain-containing protein [Cyclobacteriaceae bacterium]
MSQTEQQGWIAYLRSKEFLKTLVALAIFMGIILLLIFIWLRIYTHHGQALEMPDYTEVPVDQAMADARKRNFRMGIQDSIHVLGKDGGIILKQNPTPGSVVKSQRMIYVTVSKYRPDQIMSSRLPELYGKSYERKKKELAEHFEIQSRIVDTKYDPGDPDQILEVRYKGEVLFDSRGRKNDVPIEKGDYLDFVISSKSGGKVLVPNLVCKTYEEAEFLLASLGLRVGSVQQQEPVEHLPAAWVINQSPLHGGEAIDMDSEVNLTVSSNKPEECQ